MNTITISDSKEENLEFWIYWEKNGMIIKSSSTGKNNDRYFSTASIIFRRTENGDVIKVMRLLCVSLTSIDCLFLNTSIVID